MMSRKEGRSTSDDELLRKILLVTQRHPNAKFSKFVREFEQTKNHTNLALVLSELSEKPDLCIEPNISLTYYLNNMLSIIKHESKLNETCVTIWNSVRIYARQVDWVSDAAEEIYAALCSANGEKQKRRKAIKPTDDEDNEDATPNPSEPQAAEQTTPKKTQKRGRRSVVPKAPFEADLNIKPVKQLSAEKRYETITDSNDLNLPKRYIDNWAKYKKYRETNKMVEQDEDDYLHPAMRVHATVTNPYNSAETHNKRSFLLMTRHIEHRYNTPVQGIHFGMHYKVKDYLEAEEEEATQPKKRKWTGLSDDYIQEYLQVENYALNCVQKIKSRTANRIRSMFGASDSGIGGSIITEHTESSQQEERANTSLRIPPIGLSSTLNDSSVLPEHDDSIDDCGIAMDCSESENLIQDTSTEISRGILNPSNDSAGPDISMECMESGNSSTTAKDILNVTNNQTSDDLDKNVTTDSNMDELSGREVQEPTMETSQESINDSTATEGCSGEVQERINDSLTTDSSAIEETTQETINKSTATESQEPTIEPTSAIGESSAINPTIDDSIAMEHAPTIEVEILEIPDGDDEEPCAVVAHVEGIGTIKTEVVEMIDLVDDSTNSPSLTLDRMPLTPPVSPDSEIIDLTKIRVEIPNRHSGLFSDLDDIDRKLLSPLVVVTDVLPEIQYAVSDLSAITLKLEMDSFMSPPMPMDVDIDSDTESSIFRGFPQEEVPLLLPPELLGTFPINRTPVVDLSEISNKWSLPTKYLKKYALFKLSDDFDLLMKDRTKRRNGVEKPPRVPRQFKPYDCVRISITPDRGEEFLGFPSEEIDQKAGILVDKQRTESNDSGVSDVHRLSVGNVQTPDADDPKNLCVDLSFSPEFDSTHIENCANRTVDASLDVRPEENVSDAFIQQVEAMVELDSGNDDVPKEVANASTEQVDNIVTHAQGDNETGELLPKPLDSMEDDSAGIAHDSGICELFDETYEEPPNVIIEDVADRNETIVPPSVENIPPSEENNAQLEGVADRNETIVPPPVQNIPPSEENNAQLEDTPAISIPNSVPPVVESDHFEDDWFNRDDLDVFEDIQYETVTKKPKYKVSHKSIHFEVKELAADIFSSFPTKDSVVTLQDIMEPRKTSHVSRYGLALALLVTQKNLDINIIGNGDGKLRQWSDIEYKVRNTNLHSLTMENKENPNAFQIPASQQNLPDIEQGAMAKKPRGGPKKRTEPMVAKSVSPNKRRKQGIS